MDMNAVFCALLISQINVPTLTPNKFTVADLQAQPQFRGAGPGLDSMYSIQPYLQVANDLQSMQEEDRVHKLREWARIDSLAEPTIILCRMLITKSDGVPLRRPFLGGPSFEFEGGIEDFPDEPLLFFKDVPFFAVSGYGLGGQPEAASHYVEYALSVGRWRELKYTVKDEMQLTSVAKELIRDQRRDDFNDARLTNARLERWVMSQVGPPRPENP